MAGTMWSDPRWPDPRFLIPKPIVAALDRGRYLLRQETNPFRRVELEQLLIQASRGSVEAVGKLLALDPPSVRAEIYKKQREREDAARATWLENQKRRTEKTTPSRLRLGVLRKAKSSVAVAMLVLLYLSALGKMARQLEEERFKSIE